MEAFDTIVDYAPSERTGRVEESCWCGLLAEQNGIPLHKSWLTFIPQSLDTGISGTQVGYLSRCDGSTLEQY